jgi:hypothetical protein
MKIFAAANITVRGRPRMLNNQTAEKLRAMKLPAMAAEFMRQTESPNMDALGFEERVGMMTDAE